MATIPVATPITPAARSGERPCGTGATIVGERLRKLRASLGLTLHDVEVRSAGEFRPSALGAYERGERSLSIHRLVRLAAIYAVEPAALITDERELDLPALQRAEAIEEGADEQPTVDLEFVLGALVRFASHVHSMRHEPLGTPLTVRASDLEILEVIVGRDRGTLRRLLGQFEIRAPSPR